MDHTSTCEQLVSQPTDTEEWKQTHTDCISAFLSPYVIWFRSGFDFFETSAKDNINVKQTFERLVDIICDKMSESLETDPAVTTGTQGTARLTDNPPPQQQPNCAC